jgi:hypothetical protein
MIARVSCDKKPAVVLLGLKPNHLIRILILFTRVADQFLSRRQRSNQSIAAMQWTDERGFSGPDGQTGTLLRVKDNTPARPFVMRSWRITAGLQPTVYCAFPISRLSTTAVSRLPRLSHTIAGVLIIRARGDQESLGVVDVATRSHRTAMGRFI